MLLVLKCEVARAVVLARVVNYAPRVMLQIGATHTDNSRGIIYNQNMSIVQATASYTPYPTREES